MANNKEMGVLIDLEDQNDKILYEEAYKEIEYINSTSQKFKFNINHSNEEIKNSIKKVNPKEESNKNGKGHCIRCGTSIKMDPEHPYCLEDYQKWKEYEDENYEEKKGVCHICGKPNLSSLKKPVCVSCYNKNKKLFRK